MQRRPIDFCARVGLTPVYRRLCGPLVDKTFHIIEIVDSACIQRMNLGVGAYCLPEWVIHPLEPHLPYHTAVHVCSCLPSIPCGSYPIPFGKIAHASSSRIVQPRARVCGIVLILCVRTCELVCVEAVPCCDTRWFHRAAPSAALSMALCLSLPPHIRSS